MKNNQNKDSLEALLYAYMMTKTLRKVSEMSQEAAETFSAEVHQVMKEIEQFNLMNAINRALDNGDKEAFMKLTGELNERITVSV